jgi:hypothetical protein
MDTSWYYDLCPLTALSKDERVVIAEAARLGVRDELAAQLGHVVRKGDRRATRLGHRAAHRPRRPRHHHPTPPQPAPCSHHHGRRSPRSRRHREHARGAPLQCTRHQATTKAGGRCVVGPSLDSRAAARRQQERRPAAMHSTPVGCPGGSRYGIAAIFLVYVLQTATGVHDDSHGAVSVVGYVGIAVCCAAYLVLLTTTIGGINERRFRSCFTLMVVVCVIELVIAHQYAESMFVFIGVPLIARRGLAPSQRSAARCTRLCAPAENARLAAENERNRIGPDVGTDSTIPPHRARCWPTRCRCRDATTGPLPVAVIRPRSLSFAASDDRAPPADRTAWDQAQSGPGRRNARRFIWRPPGEPGRGRLTTTATATGSSLSADARHNRERAARAGYVVGHRCDRSREPYRVGPAPAPGRLARQPRAQSHRREGPHPSCCSPPLGSTRLGGQRPRLHRRARGPRPRASA